MPNELRGCGFGVVTFASWRGREGPATVGECEAYGRYCVASEVYLGLSRGCGGIGKCVVPGGRCSGCGYAEALAGGRFEQRFSGCGAGGFGVVAGGSGMLGGSVELSGLVGGVRGCIDASGVEAGGDGRVFASRLCGGVAVEGDAGRDGPDAVVDKCTERSRVDGGVEGVGQDGGTGGGCLSGVSGNGGENAGERCFVGTVGLPTSNVERNRKIRMEKKARKLRKQEMAKKDDVPEWRKKFATGDLADSWAARKVRENKLAILKADEQIKRLESGAGKPRLQSKVLTEAEQEAKIRADYTAHMQKTSADIAYWKKRQEAGAVDKAIKLEMEIMDGQISGKYDPFASRRTIGWAKTVKTNSTGGSSANKTVWSGSGASAYSSRESVVSLEKYEKDLKRKDEEVQYYRNLSLEARKAVEKAEQHWLDQGEADYDY